MNQLVVDVPVSHSFYSPDEPEPSNVVPQQFHSDVSTEAVTSSLSGASDGEPIITCDIYDKPNGLSLNHRSFPYDHNTNLQPILPSVGVEAPATIGSACIAPEPIIISNVCRDNETSFNYETTTEVKTGYCRKIGNVQCTVDFSATSFEVQEKPQVTNASLGDCAVGISKVCEAKISTNYSDDETLLESDLPYSSVEPSLILEEPRPVILSCHDSVSLSKQEGDFFFCQRTSDTNSCINYVKNDFSLDISPAVQFAPEPLVTDQEFKNVENYVDEGSSEREKRLKQIRDAVYKRRASETPDQRQTRLEKDKLRQRKRRKNLLKTDFVDLEKSVTSDVACAGKDVVQYVSNVFENAFGAGNAAPVPSTMLTDFYPQVDSQIQIKKGISPKTEVSPNQRILSCVETSLSIKAEPDLADLYHCDDSTDIDEDTAVVTFPENTGCELKDVCSDSNEAQLVCYKSEDNYGLSDDSSMQSYQLDSCITEEEMQCIVNYTKDSLDDRGKKLQQIREAVYRKRASETKEQRKARLEKDKLRQRKRRLQETDEQREKRLLTMRLHKRLKRSIHSADAMQKNFINYYMEEMFRYPETQEEQGSPLNMIVRIDPTWVIRTLEKQQFRCAVETEDQRKMRLQKDMMRQRKKRAEETTEQRAKRLEAMRVNKRIRRSMESDDQRNRRLEYSRRSQFFKRLHENEEQRTERLEKEKLRQREKRASQSLDERDFKFQEARERLAIGLTPVDKVPNIFDNLQNCDSLCS